MAREERGLGFLPVGLLSPSALRPAAPPQAPQSAEIVIDTDDDENVRIDPKTGAIEITHEDGTIEIDMNPQPDAAERLDSKFGDNLAEVLDSSTLGAIASQVIVGIQQDEMSRQNWLDDRARGMRLLGLKLKDPRSAIDTTAALEGMSNVDHPLLLEAVLNFWANASGELLPAGGPVKMDDKLRKTGASQKLAEQLEEDFNYYLTTVATEYYPDTSRALLQTGFGGLIVKKVYNCPLRQRPVSEAIDAVNLIVSNASTDLRNSGRFTHVVTMRPSVLRRMQLAGAYRDVPITVPSGLVPNVVEQEIANIQGVAIISQQTEDREHVIYECYTEIDIPGFEDERDGEKTGLPLPYRVVIDRDSHQVLEIRRNWREDDETKTAKVPFVVFVFVPGFGFYGIGLLHILGNTTTALTAAWRETLDAGMFANFPGFLYTKALGHQNSMEIRVPPGGGMGLETMGEDIRQSVMPLPYKDVSPAFVDFQGKIQEQGRALGGSAQVEVAEGRQDAPVGTTLAMLEQATKVEKATHKELWRSQAQELMLLKECFRENPGSFLRAIKQRGETDWDEQSFLQALNDASLVPQADPNTPSHMHRLMKAMGLIQLDKAYPGVMDPVSVCERAVTILGFGDFDALKNKQPQQGGMPPELMVEMQRLMLEGQKLADKSTDREFKLRLEVMKGKIAQMDMAAQQQAREHALQLEMQQQQGIQLQHTTDLRQSEMELEGRRVEAAADVHVANARVEEAEIAGRHDVKAEEVKHEATDTAGKHATAAEQARQKTEETKGKHATATARATPRPRQATKRSK